MPNRKERRANEREAARILSSELMIWASVVATATSTDNVDLLDGVSDPVIAAWQRYGQALDELDAAVWDRINSALQLVMMVGRTKHFTLGDENRKVLEETSGEVVNAFEFLEAIARHKRGRKRNRLLSNALNSDFGATWVEDRMRPSSDGGNDEAITPSAPA